MKIINPTSKFIFGDIKKHRQAKSNEVNSDLMLLASSLDVEIDTKKVTGSRIEQKYLPLIYSVSTRHLYVVVTLARGLNVKEKTWIRDWLTKHNYCYKDKTYGWTKNITASTKELQLGPYSKKPWVFGNKSSYASSVRFFRG